MADVNPIPEGYPRVTPYLYIDGAAKAIDFYEKVLGAKERMRLPGPDGKLGHAELENQFYGDRTGTFEDPWGHHWTVATHVEDVSADEMEKRAAEVMSG